MNKTALDTIIEELQKYPSIKSCDIECSNEHFFSGAYTQLKYYYVALENINDSKITIVITSTSPYIFLSNKTRPFTNVEKDASNLLQADLKMIELEELGKNIKNHDSWISAFKYKYQAELHL